MCGSKLYHVFVYTVYLVIEDSANLTVFKKQPPTWLTANRNLTKLIFLLTFNKDSMATTLNWRKFTNRLQTDSNKDSTTHISSKMHRHWPCLFPLLTKTVIFRKTLLTLSYQDYLQIQLCFVYCFGDPQPPNTL